MLSANHFNVLMFLKFYFLVAQMVKDLLQYRRLGFDPWVRKIPWIGRKAWLLQYFCLENSMGRRAWQAIVHGITKSLTQLSD